MIPMDEVNNLKLVDIVGIMKEANRGSKIRNSTVGFNSSLGKVCFSIEDITESDFEEEKKKLGDGSDFTLYNALSSTGGDAKEIYRKIYSAIKFSESFATTKEFTAHGVYKKDAKSVHKIDEKWWVKIKIDLTYP